MTSSPVSPGPAAAARPRGTARARRLVWVAVAAAAVMLAEAATSAVLWFGVPRGPAGGGGGRMGASRSKEYLGIDRAAWADLHIWLGVALLAIVVVHVAMHRRWIACQVRRLVREARGPAPRRTPRMIGR